MKSRVSEKSFVTGNFVFDASSNCFSLPRSPPRWLISLWRLDAIFDTGTKIEAPRDQRVAGSTRY